MIKIFKAMNHNPPKSQTIFLAFFVLKTNQKRKKEKILTATYIGGGLKVPWFDPTQYKGNTTSKKSNAFLIV